MYFKSYQQGKHDWKKITKKIDQIFQQKLRIYEAERYFTFIT